MVCYNECSWESKNLEGNQLSWITQQKSKQNNKYCRCSAVHVLCSVQVCSICPLCVQVMFCCVGASQKTRWGRSQHVRRSLPITQDPHRLGFHFRQFRQFRSFHPLSLGLCSHIYLPQNWIPLKSESPLVASWGRSPRSRRKLRHFLNRMHTRLSVGTFKRFK